MAADAPTILATSGGLFPAQRNPFAFGPLLSYAIDLAGVAGRAPRVCLVNTAGGDQAWFSAYFQEAGRIAGAAVSDLRLFTMPNVDDMAAYVLDQDVIWVGGGSVANLLALWRMHGLDEIFRQAWQAGVVLAGVSAGSICWHIGGTTDSFGPDAASRHQRPRVPAVLERRALRLRGAAAARVPPLHRGRGPARRIRDRRRGGLLYRGTELVEAVAEINGKKAYRVALSDGQVREEPCRPGCCPAAPERQSAPVTGYLPPGTLGEPPTRPQRFLKCRPRPSGRRPARRTEPNDPASRCPPAQRLLRRHGGAGDRDRGRPRP